MKHGDARDGRRAREYETWCAIKRRCNDPRQKDWPRYGGKGITVCDEWQESYATFLADMGRRPSPEHSIERIDGTKGYQRDNCRWATRAEQVANRRSNKITPEMAAEMRLLHVRGAKIRDIAADFGISHWTVTDLFRSGERRTWR